MHHIKFSEKEIKLLIETFDNSRNAVLSIENKLKSQCNYEKNICGLFMEENKEGEWTISYTLQDAETGVEYDNYYDGPMSKDEANIIINNCISESNTKRKKYGTVYNLRTENSSLNSLIMLIIFILPYLFFYLFYKIRNQTDN